MSTNAFGSSDLDLRPPEMQRSTIWSWVQQCPECGYCAESLQKRCRHPDLLTSEAYRELLSSTVYPGLASSFLCRALLDEADKDWRQAGWHTVCAAWACDDEDATTAAASCRLLAVDRFGKALAHGGDFCDDTDLHTLVLADLLRRAGEFARAAALCEQPPPAGEGARRALLFQRSLVARRDTATYTFAEVKEFTGE
jgi:hypothetical protein